MRILLGLRSLQMCVHVYVHKAGEHDEHCDIMILSHCTTVMTSILNQLTCRQYHSCEGDPEPQ